MNLINPLLPLGTVVAMEKEPGILKEEHTEMIESLRDQVEKELQQYRDTHVY